MRGLPGAQPDKATAGDVYGMACRRIKELWPNGIPNGIPNHLTGSLPNDYQKANGYSTEAAYRDTHQEVYHKVDQEVYQVDQDSLKHRRYWNQPPPEDFHRGRRIRGRRSQEKITGNDHRKISQEKDHRKRSCEKREVNQDIHQDAHRVAHREAVYRDVYQEVNWKVTNAMFRTTSLRSIYKSMPIADDY